MRTTDEFHATCANCNKPIVSVSREGVCKCGSNFLLDWPEVKAAKP